MDTLTPEPVAPSPTQPQAKKRRGRPRVMDEMREQAARFIAPNAHTRRTLLNWNFVNKALLVLGEFDELRWIFNMDAMKQGTPHACRPVVLTELGRIDDAGEMYLVALEICELKPKTSREACVMIRKWRMARDGKAHKKADALELAKMLAKVVDDYCATHPGWNYNQIRNALDMVRANSRPDDDAPDDDATLAGP